MDRIKQPTTEELQIWINAIRSGKYNQAQYYLNRDNGFCCLGLACNLFIKKEDLKKELDDTIKGGLPEDQPSAPDWLIAINDQFERKIGVLLSALNDADYTFDEIADLIELVYVHEALN
jgi:hypothetical protein